MKVDLEVRFAWWWPLYLNALVTIALLTGREPDYEKLGKVVRRAMRCRMTRL